MKDLINRDIKTGLGRFFNNPKEPGTYILGFEDAIDKKIAYLEQVFPATHKINNEYSPTIQVVGDIFD